MSNCKKIAEDVILKTVVLFQGATAARCVRAADAASVPAGNLMLRDNNHGPPLCERLASVGASMCVGRRCRARWRT